jgi:hypothetical protein
MKIKDSKSNKIICLSSSFDNRAKVLNFVYFILFTAAGIAFIYLPFSEGGPYVFGMFVFVGIVSGIYLFAAYRFINKTLQTEKLIINKDTLTISRIGFFNKKVQTYEISKISNFRHLEKHQISKHQLAGESFDYLGFQTEQQVINEMHGDNRVAFEYDNKTIQFGENIYSWDFEELEIIFSNVTGKDFRTFKNLEKTYSLTN